MFGTRMMMIYVGNQAKDLLKGTLWGEQEPFPENSTPQGMLGLPAPEQGSTLVKMQRLWLHA